MNEFKRGPIGRALSILLFLIVLIGMPVAKADILRLRDGRMFTGQFLGATKEQIWFQADTPATTNAARYARIVEEHALLRRLIAVAGEIAEIGYSVPDDVVAAMDLNTRWGQKYFNGETLKTTETMGILKERMQLAPVKNTKLISITVYSDDSQAAAGMANEIALLRPTWMPTAVAASWSMATACMAAPCLLRCRNSVSAAMATAVTASTSTL